MKTLATSIVAALFVVTSCPATDAAPINLPSKSAIIIQSKPQPPVDVQPTPLQPNLSGSSVPSGTEVTPSAQASTSIPLTVPNIAIPSGLTSPYDFDPVVTLKEKHKFKDTGWISNDRYEISRVEGLNNNYVPGEQIAFEVTGWSSILEVNDINGFNVMATLFELPANRVNRGKTTYNPDTHVWQSKFTVPLDSTKEYKILINLFCEKMNSPCTNTFGERTQVDKIFPIQAL